MAQIKLNKWDLYRKIIRHWLVCDHETSREQTEINISDDIIKLIFKFNQFILTFDTSASVATSHDIVNHDEPNIIQFDTMYLRWIYVTFGTQNIIFEWVDDPVKPTYDEEIIISYHMNDTMDYIYPDETESYFIGCIVVDSIEHIQETICSYYDSNQCLGCTKSSYALNGNIGSFGNDSHWSATNRDFKIKENETAFIKFEYHSESKKTDISFAIQKQDDTYIHFVKAFEDVDNLIIPAVSIKAGQAIKFEISSQKIMYHA
eukprot:580362_1